MGARAIWKGVIHIASQTVPVKLYSAVEDRTVHFRLLNSRTHKPVQQQLVDPLSDALVPYGEAQRGYKIDEGFIVLRKDELDALAPKPSRDISVSRFVTPQKLGAEWYVRPYYLGPDGDDEAYFALSAALAEEDKEGIAHWVMRNKEYTGVLREHEGYLVLITLRHAEEVIGREQLPRPEGRAHSDKELKMAEQLVAAFADEFDPNQYKDEYRERVLAFVEAKAKGKKPRLKKPVEKKKDVDLAAALAKSIAGLKKERHVA